MKFSLNKVLILIFSLLPLNLMAEVKLECKVGTSHDTFVPIENRNVKNTKFNSEGFVEGLVFEFVKLGNNIRFRRYDVSPKELDNTVLFEILSEDKSKIIASTNYPRDDGYLADEIIVLDLVRNLVTSTLSNTPPVNILKRKHSILTTLFVCHDE